MPIIVDDESIGTVITFQNITYLQNLEKNIRVKLLERGFIAKYNFDNIVHKSNQIENCIENAKKYSKYDSPILIEGPSGVGKELFVQSIHNYGSRKNRPFIAINCAAIPPTLIESELFGYVGGAFTGAKKSGKAGIFELGHGGTLLVYINKVGPKENINIEVEENTVILDAIIVELNLKLHAIVGFCGKWVIAKDIYQSLLIMKKVA